MSGWPLPYQEGFAVGQRYADADRENGYPLGSGADTVLAEAVEAREDISRSWRAFKLGIARGYRSVAMSKLGGKWGT